MSTSLRLLRRTRRVGQTNKQTNSMINSYFLAIGECLLRRRPSISSLKLGPNVMMLKNVAVVFIFFFVAFVVFFSNVHYWYQRERLWCYQGPPKVEKNDMYRRSRHIHVLRLLELGER